MSTGHTDRRSRGLLAVGLIAVVVTAFVTVDPLHLHPVDEWLRALGHAVGPADSEGTAEGSLWTCGMHPEVIQDHPGTCPICRMELTPLEASAVSRPEGPAELWTCPMHPEVIQDHPGACPICGMDLVARPGGQPGHDHEKASATPGTAPIVALEPGVVQQMNVATALVERRNLARRVRTVGSLDYDQQRMVTVTTRFSGFVESSRVGSVGQPIRAGQPLFDIYSPDLVQTQRELIAAVAYAAELRGAPPEVRSRAEKLVEATRTRLSYWEIPPDEVAEIERTGVVMRTLTVRAPSSGVVMKLAHGLDGMALQPGMDVVHLADLSRMLLTVEVFEDQQAWLRPGTTATATFDSLPGRQVEARVRYIEPEVNPTTRTVQLVLELPNEDNALRVGMYATVVFAPVAVHDAVVVPAQAVIRTGERDVVVVALGEGRFQPREVTLGLEADGVFEVRSGLAPGETIVTSAQFLIDSESNLEAAIQKMIAARRR